MLSTAEFLSKNMPLDYRACFTLKINDNCAKIVGSIAACDALGNLIAREDNIECEPQILLEAAIRLSERQPGIEGLSEIVMSEIERIQKSEIKAVGY